MKTKISGLFALALLAPASLVACADTAEDPPSANACEENPEQPAPRVGGGGLAPQRIATNGTRLNGIGLNGIGLNGVGWNGAKFNGTKLNGARFNGINLNSFKLNGLQLNGIKLNSINLNGVNLGVEVAANELMGTTGGGHVVGGDDFVGATLTGVLDDQSTVELAITAFEREGSFAYYRIDYQGESICSEGEKGMFIPGTWDATGQRHDAQTLGAHTVSMSFSCMSGALAKCATFGYAPWAVGKDMHQACTRMVRADYCGTGVSYTKDGTMIDIFDAKGVQSPASGEGFLFEAAWGTSGAVCAKRPRYDARSVDGESVLPSCFSSLPSCDSLEEGTAKGGLLANASRPQSRLFCR